MTKFYIGPDGSDVADGLSRANRVKGAARLVTLLGSASGPHQVMMEGVFDESVTGWTSSTLLNISGIAAASIDGVRFSATRIEDSTAPWPIICNYKRVTAAATFTDLGANAIGMKIWGLASAIASTSNKVRRLYAADWKPVQPATTLVLGATSGSTTATAGTAQFTTSSNIDIGKTIAAGNGLAKITSITSTTVANVTTIPGRAFASTSFASGAWTIENPDFFKKELWEGGTVNAATSFASVYNNLGTYGHDWTNYDATGAATTNLYVASEIDPVLRWGPLCYQTDEKTSLFTISGPASFTVDPEITVRGCGFQAMLLSGVGSGGAAQMNAKLVGGSFYTNMLTIDGTCKNVKIAAVIDAETTEVPFYSATNTTHVMGGHEGVTIKPTCELAGTTDGTGINFQASCTMADGKVRPSRISNFLHAGISQIAPTGGRVHQNIVIEDGFSFDFLKVPYGRPFAFGGAAASVKNNRVGAIICIGSPTMNQPCGANWQVSGGLYVNRPDIGDGYVLRWGGSTNKAGTSRAFAAYTATGTDLGDGVLADNWVVSPGGFMDVSEFNSVAISGAVTITGNKIVNPGDPKAYIGNFEDAAELLSQNYAQGNVTSRDRVRWINNAAIGYSGTVCRYFQTTPSVNTAYTIGNLPNAITTGWAQYPTLAAYALAAHQGQLDNLLG